MPRRPFLLLLVFSAAFSAVFAADRGLAWPEIHSAAKPWTRWWWLGNIADPASLSSEMERYAAAGLGGLELTPIYGVRGEEDRFVPFLSSAWLKNFHHAVDESQRLGLGLDLANGTGWPFGGPWLDDGDAAHYLARRTFAVAPGTALPEPVRFQQRGLVRVAGPRRVALAELRQPIAANPNLQDLALDQVRFETALPLVSLMAFPMHGAPLDLTTRVLADGRLDWTAPADQGRWTLYALFQGQHGKMVERAAPGGEGYALDHLSAGALHHYLAHFDAVFAGHDGRGVRAFFNDSYEVDDAQGESDFTPGFFDEFAARRGYDLRTQLPALFAADPRVLSDYRETVSDLLRDHFTRPWRAWAQSHHALIRNQAHGAPANLLDLYAASDIPEQEGADVLALELAASAAHLAGKPLASAETGTWLDEHFLGTLGELKTAVDTDFLGGINHVVYHGTAFSPPGEPWPGFQFYASVELNPQNPIWADFPALNLYVARAQSFLQSGGPDEDVLLYYNIHDRWAQPGDGTLPHFHGGARDGVGARETAAALRSAGIGFDYASDHLLAAVQGDGNRLVAASARYAAIVLPPTDFMPAATLAHLVDLAAGGATLLVLKHLPVSAPGRLGSPESLAPLLAKIKNHASDRAGVTTAPVGRGAFLIGDSLPALLAECREIPRETMRDLGLDFIRRRTVSGALYFIVNRTSRAFDGWVSLHASGQSAALYDPMTAACGVGALVKAPGQGSRVYLQLAPGESRIVEVHAREIAGARWSYWRARGAPQPLPGEWSVTFDQGGPTRPSPAKLTTLVSWTDFGGDAGKSFAGTATYALALDRPHAPADAWRLDLGAVGDSAHVRLNGRELAALLQPPSRVVIPSRDLRESNTLEIIVTNLAANRVAYLDRRGVPWKKFYNVNFPPHRRENAGPDGLFTAARLVPHSSGLIGPVTLTPLVVFHPSPL